MVWWLNWRAAAHGWARMPAAPLRCICSTTRAAALSDHLNWSRNKARATLVKSLDDGLIVRAGELLVLTPKGRMTAREILEPWALKEQAS